MNYSFFLLYRIHDYPYSECWQSLLAKHRLNRSVKGRQIAIALYQRLTAKVTTVLAEKVPSGQTEVEGLTEAYTGVERARLR